MLNVIIICAAMLVGSAHAALLNGDFEALSFSNSRHHFVNPNRVEGWETLSSKGKIEIWSNTAHGVTSYKNNQHVELNAHYFDTLFQDVAGIGAGLEVGFHFAHRGRAGVDTMNLSITDLGKDETFGTMDDELLFTRDYSTGRKWTRYTNQANDSILTKGNILRFAYKAVETATGNKSVGNFLDDVGFGVGVGVQSNRAVRTANTQQATINEPTTMATLTLGLALMLRLKTKRS